MALKVPSSGSVDTDKAIRAVAAAIPDLAVFAGARELGPIALVAGVQKRVPHGLKRKYRGFLLSGLSAVATITDARTKSDTDTYLYLTATGANATVHLVVF